MALEFPLSPESKSSIENADFLVLKSQQFKGSLPVFSSVPTYTGKEGEIILQSDTTNSYYRIYCYLNGAWRKAGDTNFATGAFTETFQQFTAVDNSAWEDYSLAAYIPTNANAVEIVMYNGAGVDKIMGVRKNGGTASRYFTIPNGGYVTITTQIVSDRTIQIYTNSSNELLTPFYLMGYWT